MYWLTKLAQNKLAVMVMAALVFGLILTPVLAAEDDLFGFDPIEGQGDFAEEEKIALGQEDVRSTISKVINVALGLLGVVAVVIILWGGFRWMTAGGNDEKTAEARKIIFAGIIGLAIILSAWAIAKFVITELSGATGSGEIPE